MSKELAEQAVKGLTDNRSAKTAGYCQKWVRQQIQKTYGSRFDKYMAESATLTMEAFRDSPYFVEVDRDQLGGGSVPGDILYKGTKTSGRFGHVGIRILGNKVAENSSSHVSGRGDARGTRSLQAFGKFEGIVRLPSPSELK